MSYGPPTYNSFNRFLGPPCTSLENFQPSHFCSVGFLKDPSRSHWWHWCPPQRRRRKQSGSPITSGSYPARTTRPWMGYKHQVRTQNPDIFSESVCRDSYESTSKMENNSHPNSGFLGNWWLLGDNCVPFPRKESFLTRSLCLFKFSWWFFTDWDLMGFKSSFFITISGIFVFIEKTFEQWKRGPWLLRVK